MNRIRTTITAAILTVGPLAVIIATAAPRTRM